MIQNRAYLILLAFQLCAQDAELYKAISAYARSSVEKQLDAGRANAAIAAEISAGRVPIGYAEFYKTRAADLVPLILYRQLTGSNLDNLAGGALTAAFSQRKDTQTEAPSGSDASTSLVMKGLAPKVLAWAVEHGALQRDVKDTNVTFRGNVAGIVRALTNESPVEILFPEKTFWNGVSLAVTFETSRGPQPGTLLANKQQIAAWTVRSEILNTRDPSAARYRAQWQQLAYAVFNELSATSSEVAKALEPAQTNETLFEKRKGLMEDLISDLKHNVDDLSIADVSRSATLEKWHEAAAQIVERRLAEIADKPLHPELRLALERYYQALEPALRRREELKRFISQGVLLTADYSVKRDTNVPDLSIITGIFEISPDKARHHELTFNGSVSFFNNLPQQATYKRLRDSKIAVQYDVPLKMKGGSSANFLLSIAGRWENIPDPVPLTTNDTLAVIGGASAAVPGTSVGLTAPPMIPSGQVGVFQAKLTIPIGNTGLRLPLSLTVSNRKNLIEEKWSFGANFGLTLNFDALIPSLKR